MCDYLPAIFFIGMMISGQQAPEIGVPLGVLCAVGFYLTAKKLGTEEKIK
jgi:hypothetical protein